MANLTNNRVDATLSAEAVQTIKDHIQGIVESLPFLIGLTPQERMSVPKISVKNKVFAEDAISAAANNSELLPSFIKVEAMQRDLSLFHALDEISGLLKQLYEKVADTQTLAGSEAYTSALTVYKIFGAASEAGIKGTKSVHEQLRARFVQSSSGSVQATPTEEVAE